MKRELIAKSLIGAITYIVSVVEIIYVWLQLFNGSGYYYDLGGVNYEVPGPGEYWHW